MKVTEYPSVEGLAMRAYGSRRGDLRACRWVYTWLVGDISHTTFIGRILNPHK